MERVETIFYTGGDTMLHERLRELDLKKKKKMTATSRKVLHALIDEMKSLIEWCSGTDGRYAVDKSTGKVIIQLDASDRIIYTSGDLQPMSVLFA
jgi:hypothetical protein